VRVTNPQQDDLTIASVTVDDAIVPFSLDGPQTLSRLRSSTIVIPYDWTPEDPISVGVTSSSGIETVEAIAAAVETPTVSAGGFLGYAIIGFLVGVLPVALGLLWLPSLRRVDQRWLTAFMAMTAGLLSFLGVEALFEAFELQGALPGAFGGPGLVLLGVATSFLTMTFISGRFSANANGMLGGVALATLVAIGIGLHNFGEGLAIGSAFSLGEATLGALLIIGFALHNTTEGLAIVAPLAREKQKVGLADLMKLGLIGGAPTIAGAWLGGLVYSPIWSVLFLALGVGAIAQVTRQIAKQVGKEAEGGRAFTSTPVLAGLLAGFAVMYVTGMLVG
jgi:zinc transporter ZupT